MTSKAIAARYRAADEGDKHEVTMRILGKPSPGLTLRVEIIDSNPPDSSSSMDELRFRGRSYPIGTQSGNMYVMCIDTSARPEDVVTQWERPSIRFYRYYGEECGYRQKAIIRFTWCESPYLLTGVRLHPIPTVVVDRAAFPRVPPEE